MYLIACNVEFEKKSVNRGEGENWKKKEEEVKVFFGLSYLLIQPQKKIA